MFDLTRFWVYPSKAYNKKANNQTSKGKRVKAKLVVFLVVAVFVYSLVLVVWAEDGTSVWRDDMDYQSLDQLQTGGWTATHQSGVNFSGTAIILDGTSQDTSIHYTQFPSGISDWKVEDKSRWTMGSHCGNSVTAVTDKHSYAFMADGWYGNFVFYRDGQKTTFGSFQESKNTWFTLAIEKQGNQINMYYNGEVKSTYTETDTSTSQLVRVDAVSPWKGGSEYDYFEVWQIGDSSTQEPQQSLLSNPIVIGGIVGAVGVGVGGVLYFFVYSGGAAGSAGGAAGSGGATGGSGSSGGSGGGGSGSGGEENPMLHPSGGTLIHPSGSGSSNLQSSTPSTLHSTQPSTLNEVAMNDAIPTKFTHTDLNNSVNHAVQTQSDSQAQMNQNNNTMIEVNQANHDRLNLHQQLQDQINRPQQQIQNDKINTQNKINQQTNQLLQGSSGEVADSGGSSSET